LHTTEEPGRRRLLASGSGREHRWRKRVASARVRDVKCEQRVLKLTPVMAVTRSHRIWCGGMTRFLISSKMYGKLVCTSTIVDAHGTPYDVRTGTRIYYHTPRPRLRRS
jgi:hypothetical protein